MEMRSWFREQNSWPKVHMADTKARRGRPRAQAANLLDPHGDHPELLDTSVPNSTKLGAEFLYPSAF